MRKSERLSVLLSIEEKHTLRKLAEIEGGLSNAAFIRRLIRKAAQEKGLWPPLSDPPTSSVKYRR